MIWDTRSAESVYLWFSSHQTSWMCSWFVKIRNKTSSSLGWIFVSMCNWQVPKPALRTQDLNQLRRAIKLWVTQEAVYDRMFLDECLLPKSSVGKQKVKWVSDLCVVRPQNVEMDVLMKPVDHFYGVSKQANKEGEACAKMPIDLQTCCMWTGSPASSTPHLSSVTDSTGLTHARQLVLPALKSWRESLIIYAAAHISNTAGVWSYL